MSERLVVALVTLVLCLPVSPSASAATIIAHRGASGVLPEHTLEAYAYAYASGADYLEPDLVLTADGVLVARHEPMLDVTTDVAERFPDRRAADGHFYAADLSWEELSTLRAVESRDGRFPSRYAVFAVPRFEEILALVDGLNAATGCSIGLYPELKWPAWHSERGLDPVAALRRALAESAFDGPLRIQSFEAPPLMALAADPIEGAELVRLVESPEQLDPDALAGIAAYADGVGPFLGHLAELRQRGVDAVAAAHGAGLVVDAWTLRADQLGPFADFDELVAFALDTLRVDGVFTDHPGRVRTWLDAHRQEAPACVDRS